MQRCFPMRIFITLCFFCFLSSHVRSQDQVMFFINPYSFNPSYAGVEGRPAFYLNYRRQWINVDGSPQIGNLSFHMPLKRFLSVGANVVNDSRGLFNTNSVLLSGAYTVVLGDFKSVRFGLSAGGGQSTLDFSKVTDTSDPALTAAVNSFLQGSAGVSFHLKSFHGGITLPSIFEPSYISGNASALAPLQNLVLHVSNRFYWYKNKHLLEPHLIYHYSNVVPSYVEAALLYHVNNLVWLGGSYKQRFGSSAFMGLHLKKTLGIGYAYTFKTQSGAELNSPSHEIQITLLLGDKRKDIPFYSFVDTDKEKRIQHHTEHVSASQVIAQNRTSKTPVVKTPPPPKKEEPVVKKTEPVKPPVKQEPVGVKPAEQKPVEVVKKESEPVKKALGEMPHVHDTLHPAHTEEKEKIARLQEHAENPAAQHGQENDTHPHAERHEFVKKGSHNSELEVGDYVIAGVFRSEINAGHFAEGLKLHGFPAKFGHLTEKNLWYVYLIQTDNLDHARTERDKYRKMLMFRDSWLLTVHH